MIMWLDLNHYIQEPELMLFNYELPVLAHCLSESALHELRHEFQLILLVSDDLGNDNTSVEALGNHLMAVRRDYEHISRLEEKRIRDDAAREEAKRKEKDLMEERLRQERIEAEKRPRELKYLKLLDKLAVEDNKQTGEQASNYPTYLSKAYEGLGSLSSIKSPMRSCGSSVIPSIV